MSFLRLPPFVIAPFASHFRQYFSVPTLMNPSPVNPMRTSNRFRLALNTICLFTFLLLLGIGLFGRHQAIREKQLTSLLDLNDQLQAKMDELALFSFATNNLSREGVAQPPKSAVLRESVGNLVLTIKAQLQQLAEEQRRGRIPSLDGLEHRLIEANLAIAENRFQDALTILPAGDELNIPTNSVAQLAKLARIFQVRGEAFIGLNQWAEARKRFENIHAGFPERLGPTLFLAQCEFSLGETNRSYEEYKKIASDFQRIGNEFLLQRNPVVALDSFDRALALQLWLLDRNGRSDEDVKIAAIRDSQGNANFLQGNPTSALISYENASQQLLRFIQRSGRQDLSASLAKYLIHAGNPLVGQLKLDAAGETYRRALELMTNGTPAFTPFESLMQTAITLNNRSVILRVRKKWELAFADLDRAVQLLASVSDEKSPTDLPATSIATASSGPMSIQFDVMIGFDNREIEMSTRPRLAHANPGREASVLLATVLQNRGFAYLAHGQPGPAIGDFEHSVGVLADRVERDKQTDLIPSFVSTLASTAWVYATASDGSIRDPAKATAYGTKACELENWSGVKALESLGAAAAESQHFPDAIRWQERALALSLPSSKPRLSATLELYKSGQHYRPPAKAGSASP